MDTSKLNSNQSPELLMPAGSLEKLKWAIDFGADAVYAGVPLFSLRARENEFNLEDLKTAREYTHARGKKLYLTANIFARNLKIKSFTENLARWAEFKPDALIMSDPGLISIVKKNHPDIPIHLSVQANCMNWTGVQFWKDYGVSRVILSRELRQVEIAEIHSRVPGIELEAFVHGSICIAYSGRCLPSHYMSRRDANQGVCDNSCRYNYRLYKQGEAISDDFYLQDLRDPSLLYPIDEDEHGTYIMNAKDLCLVEHLKEIKEAGVCSFKVEGRTKSDFYAAIISYIYRKAIDDMMAGHSFDPQLKVELDKLAHRGYHKGFMLGDPGPEGQNYEANPRGPQSQFSGIVHEINENGSAQFEVRNKLEIGQAVAFISSQGIKKAEVKRIYDKKKGPVQAIHPGSGIFEVEFSQTPDPRSIVTKDL